MTQSKHPRFELVRSRSLLVNCTDRSGKPIEPFVHSVAQDIAPQAVSYAQKYLSDPCVAINLLEEAAATVSHAVLARQASDLPPIRDLRAYLYRSFLRRVSAQRKTELQVDDAFEDHLLLTEAKSFEQILEARLLLKYILRMCDRKTRWIVWGRIEGRSWGEIADDVVMSNRAARLHYSRFLREIRRAFEANPEVFFEKLQKAARIRQRNRSLSNLLNAILPLRLFRALRVKSVFGIKFRITHHESEEMAADVDHVFS